MPSARRQQLGQLGGAVGSTKGITTLRMKFSLRGGREDEPEGWAGKLHFLPGSHRHITPVPRRFLFLHHRSADRPDVPAGPVEDGHRAARASQMARPSSSLSSMRQTWTVRPTRTGVASAVRWPSRTERRWLALSLDPDHAAVGPGGQRGPEAGGRLGQEGGDPSVEDAVGLVHPPVDGDAQDDAVRARLDELDVEQVVDALDDAGRHATRGRGGCGHRRMLTARR